MERLCLSSFNSLGNMALSTIKAAPSKLLHWAQHQQRLFDSCRQRYLPPLSYRYLRKQACILNLKPKWLRQPVWRQMLYDYCLRYAIGYQRQGLITRFLKPQLAQLTDPQLICLFNFKNAPFAVLTVTSPPKGLQPLSVYDAISHGFYILLNTFHQSIVVNDLIVGHCYHHNVELCLAGAYIVIPTQSALARQIKRYITTTQPVLPQHFIYNLLKAFKL